MNALEEATRDDLHTGGVAHSGRWKWPFAVDLTFFELCADDATTEVVRQGELELIARIEASVADKDFEAALAFAGRDRGAVLLHLWCDAGLLAASHLPPLIPEAWTMADVPLRDVGARRWIRLFKIAGYLDTRLAADRSELASEAVQIFRGGLPGRSMRAMSWTSERTVAETFAARAGRRGRVSTATVPATALLARFAERDEHEVVVDPRFLRGRVEQLAGPIAPLVPDPMPVGAPEDAPVPALLPTRGDDR